MKNYFNQRSLGASVYEPGTVVIEVNGVEIATVTFDDWKGQEGDVWLSVRPIEYNTVKGDWPSWRIRGRIATDCEPEKFQVQETISRLILATVTGQTLKGSTR
jgi:hypothetical protein